MENVPVPLAFFSPWPPQRSGIAGRSAELVPLLARRGYAIDVFVDALRVPANGSDDRPPAPGAVRVLSAHDFLWRHARNPYALPVYQIGNSQLHRYMWPYIFRFPGLVVIHDARVHHARALALLSADREEEYRAEFAWSHPHADPAGAELALLGLEGGFFYHWPMIRGVVESARLVAAHSRGVVDQIARDWPDRPVEHIALGEGAAGLDAIDARRRFRSKHGIDESAVLFGVHGGLTPEKRVVDIIHAFAATLPWAPDARLLLAGPADPALELRTLGESLGIGAAITHVDRLDGGEFDRSIAACDVTLNLRWPTALETSGPWVRSLCQGRPTVIIDLAHLAHVPSLDPRTWRRHEPVADLAAGAEDRAVTVALDVSDLRHSLVLAMRRLATDAPLRERLGRQAREWWAREHTIERMAGDYERAIARARALPAPSPDWPPHLRPDPAAHGRGLLAAPAWGADTGSRLGGSLT